MPILTHLYIINILVAIVALMILIKKRQWILALVAVCCATLYVYGVFFNGIPDMKTLCHMLYCEERYTETKAIASVYGSISSLIMTNFMMALFPWFKRWTLFIWFILFVLIGIITGIMSPLGITEGNYGICCAIMTMLAQMLGLSYLVTCCIENIYIHSLLPSIFAFPAAYVGLKIITTNEKGIFPAIVAISHFVIDALITYVIWNHYIHLSMKAAAQLCVEELQMAGRLIAPGWSGYVAINIIIFVIIFLCDAFMSWLLYRWTKNQY